MSTPAYVINVDRFDDLMRKHGYVTKAAFAAATGIPRRTLHRVLDHEAELTGPTIRFFLSAFPGTSFEYLFYATNPVRLRERIPA
jgi:hypothetical protein